MEPRDDVKARTLKKRETKRQKRKELQQKRIPGRHDWWLFLAQRGIGRLIRGRADAEVEIL